MIMQVRPVDRYNRMNVNKLWKVHAGKDINLLTKDIKNYLGAHKCTIANLYLFTQLINHAGNIPLPPPPQAD